jgi:bifunctional ADP-heptose synthase (sugar kinase/adenylyltransferase)
MRMVSGAGARHVIVTRGAAPALALLDGELVSAAPPQTTPNDERGAGDAMMAALAAALSARRSLVDALRHGIAAGAMNVTRSGLGTGRPEAIDLIAEHVQVTPVAVTADTAQQTSMPALALARSPATGTTAIASDGDRSRRRRGSNGCLTVQ